MASETLPMFIPENVNELCVGLKILTQEKKAGNISDTFIEKIVAKTDKFLEYKCVFTKQHTLLLLKCFS